MPFPKENCLNYHKIKLPLGSHLIYPVLSANIIHGMLQCHPSKRHLQNYGSSKCLQQLKGANLPLSSLQGNSRRTYSLFIALLYFCFRMWKFSTPLTKRKSFWPDLYEIEYVMNLDKDTMLWKLESFAWAAAK